MNDKKICFIACVNQEIYEEEMLHYLRHLSIPEGYEVDVILIRDAKSICEGYERARKSSDAKYKVYLHQDAFLTHHNFLEDVLRVFALDESIGLLGLVGARCLPQSACMWETERYGFIMDSGPMGTVECRNDLEEGLDYLEVEALDGCLLVTAADIPWREDIFTGFDFYDASICMEYRRAGLKVVVPYMDEPWIIHDCGVLNLKDYDRYREVFLQEYHDDMLVNS